MIREWYTPTSRVVFLGRFWNSEPVLVWRFLKSKKWIKYKKINLILQSKKCIKILGIIILKYKIKLTGGSLLNFRTGLGGQSVFSNKITKTKSISIFKSSDLTSNVNAGPFFFFLIWITNKYLNDHTNYGDAEKHHIN